MNEIKLAIVKEAEFMATFVDDLLKEGRLDEAREMVLSELGLVSELNETLRLKTMLAKIERASGNHREALSVYQDTYPLAKLSGHHALNANFHHGLAVVLEETGEPDKALIEYEAARFHFEEAGDSRQVGAIENNIAVILYKSGHTEKAFIHLERARACFDDPVRLAEIGVTEAEVYLRIGEPEKALELMLECQRTFKRHGAIALFNQSIPTLIKAATDYQCFAYRGEER